MQESIVLIENENFYYKTVGTGQPILVLHGWGSNSSKWENICEFLSLKGFKVFFFDLPGFGKNEKFLKKPWFLQNYCIFLENFTTILKLENFHLLGHSFGGAVAAKYSTIHLDRVKNLILVSASCLRRSTFKKKMLGILSKIFKIFSFLPYYQSLRKRFYSAIQSDYPIGQKHLKETYLNIIKEDLTDKLPLINSKTLVIWGDKDKITPLKDGIFIAKKIPKSKMVILQNIGHAPYLQEPEKFTKTILDFIKL